MGLDMYLKASKYVSGFKHSGAEAVAQFNKIISAAGLDPKDIADASPSLTLEVTVAYWRKANAIHGWFVTNVQGGVDECQSSGVSREQLQELLALCRAVIAKSKLVPARVQDGTLYSHEGVTRLMKDGEGIEDPTAAMEMLPTQGGFFFGSTQYDQYYFQDLADTVEMLEKILSNPRFEDFDFTYRASW